MNIDYSLSDIKARNHIVVKSHVNNVLFIIFLLLILEGALRKWIFPELSKPLFFLKDIFILYLYGYLFLKKKLPSNAWMSLAWFFAFSLYILVGIQVLLNEVPIFVGIYGWRNYVLYIPLAFLIEDYMDMASLKRIGKLFCYLSVPICIIAFIQYKSSTSDYINKNVGTENFSEIFTVGNGVVRPSSTFAFTTGFVLYIGTLLIFLVYNFFLKQDKFLSKAWFIITVCTFVTCLALSGSRGAYLSCGAQIGFLILGSVFLMRSKQGFKIVFYTLFALIAFVVSFNVIFDEQRDLILTRQANANSSEGSIITRIGESIINIDALMESNLSTLGVGLGLASGGGAYLVSGVSQFSLVETEWGRIFMEAGVVLGLGYILYRISLSFNLGLNSVRALFASSNPTPMVSFAFVVINLAIGQTTGNGITYSFTWLFLGVALAINKNLIEGNE